MRGPRPIGLIVGASFLSVWAASGAMMSLMEGFQAAYSLPGGRPFLKQRGIAALLVICAVVPLVFGSAIILFGTRSEHAFLKMDGVFRGDLAGGGLGGAAGTWHAEHRRIPVHHAGGGAAVLSRAEPADAVSQACCRGPAS